ncbi:MAG: hypothetical protein CVV64_16165 [Candidatus Wallbacteria bacterium HGW-Wallbacteria-1]|jgi:uncharacterized repeat protein (TIGR01451 family)|uniref:DUF11 domain-containing protein n=1 Tax=Candidatus Wallbacteria bacterium HGW-Wallbacteria-1 TaxID=2013854 RepID=A0A2N1PL16_9BACT|nr:MAG: hypothetical protein CVV64_16165 [Candidatus Wallbacteria bacterium HGW-Wallbacteria-1]
MKIKFMKSSLLEGNRKTEKRETNKNRTGYGFFVAVLGTLVFALFFPSGAMAAGTLAGTAITNQAWADYKDANGNQMARIFSNTVSTIVSRVPGVDIVPPVVTNVASNTSTTQFLAQIFNTGNAADTYTFTYTVVSGWTPLSVIFYHDSATAGNHHVYDPGIDTLLTADGSGKYHTDSAAADDDFDIFMTIGTPSAAVAPDNSTSVIKITAVSDFDGSVSDFGTYTVVITSAVINAVKTHSPESPVPGQTVTYTINLNNQGSSPGNTVIISDPIPNNMAYVPGSITLNSIAKTDLSDADEANFNVTTPNAVSVAIGTIAANGGLAVVTFQATVNSNVLINSPITNQAHITYTSGGNQIDITTNGETLFVGGLAGIDLQTPSPLSSGNPGDKIAKPFTVINNGNNDDTVKLTISTTSGWSWDIWIDTNGDGLLGPEDIKASDTNGDGIIDTGSIAPNQTLKLIAVTTIPVGTQDGITDTATITGTSTDPTKTDSIAFTITVTAPVLSMTKGVSPTGSQPPGTILTYTMVVTNSGTGISTSVSISDPIPANTTYVTSSLKTGSAVTTLSSRTDADDGDGAKFDSSTGTVSAGGTGTTLGPNGTLVLEFKVTIN